jgi:hypothetical protein
MKTSNYNHVHTNVVLPRRQCKKDVGNIFHFLLACTLLPEPIYFMQTKDVITNG